MEEKLTVIVMRVSKLFVAMPFTLSIQAVPGGINAEVKVRSESVPTMRL